MKLLQMPLKMPYFEKYCPSIIKTVRRTCKGSKENINSKGFK